MRLLASSQRGGKVPRLRCSIKGVVLFGDRKQRTTLPAIVIGQGSSIYRRISRGEPCHRHSPPGTTSRDYATSKMRVPKFVIGFWKPDGTYSVAIQRSVPLGSSVAQE